MHDVVISLSTIDILIAIAFGFGTGVLGAILGTGGGVFLVPLLILGLDVPAHFAIATSILCVIATSSAVASANVERGTANMPLGMTLEMATALGAICGSWAALLLAPWVLETAFAVSLLPTSALMWPRAARTQAKPPTLAANERPELAGPDPRARQSFLERLSGEYFDPVEGRVSYHVQRLGLGFAISYIAGMLSGLLGIGGGVFKVPALHLACGVPMKAAAATSNFMIGVTAAASAFLYYGSGEVRPVFTASVVVGVFGGSALGSFANRYLRSTLLKRLFSVLLALVAIQMFFRSLGGE